MSTPTSQLLSPSSVSPDHFGLQATGGEPSLAGSSELYADSHTPHLNNTSLSSIKTEYKSKFTPFDQYVYNEVTDSFVRPPSASPVPHSLMDHSAAGGALLSSPDVQLDLCSRASSTEQPAATEPWYKEVQRRNEKANEYRFKSEVGHSSTSQTPHCRDDYKRDHLISHLANNNNFNLPKDTSSSTSRGAGHEHATSARSTTRTPAQVRSKSQSTVRRTHAATPSTTATTTTTKNLNLTPTRAPQRHPVARPSPNVTSSTTKTPKNTTTSSQDTRKPPLSNTSASSRTPTRLAAGHQHHQESPQARPTSTTRTSSVANKRPTTATSRLTPAPRTQSSRQPISSSSATTTPHRNNVSSSSTWTPTSTQRVSHAKSSSSSNRAPASSAPSPAVKSIKTPQAIATAAATAVAVGATTVAATAPTSKPTSNPQVPHNPEGAGLVKKEEIGEEIVAEKSNADQAASSSSSPTHHQLPAEMTIPVKTEPEGTTWISGRASELEEPTNFMFSTTETGNMLADELAEAELQRQKADAFNGISHNQSYQTNESDHQHKSTEEFSQPSKDDEENQMYSIMPVIGGVDLVSKGPALETMSESLEGAESFPPSTEVEAKNMSPALTEAYVTKFSDESATEEILKPDRVVEARQNESELGDEDASASKQAVVEVANQSQASNQPLAVEPDQETSEIPYAATVAASEQEEREEPAQEVEEAAIRKSASEITRQESEVSLHDKINMEEQSHSEDDLNKLPEEDVFNQEVSSQAHQEEHNLLGATASQQPHPFVMPEAHQELDQLDSDPAKPNKPGGDQSDESQIKALDEEVTDNFVKNGSVDRVGVEPVVERQTRPELLMDVNDLLDEEARKKLEMSKKSELARKSSSPLTDVGEVLLSPTQLNLGSQKEIKYDKYIHDGPLIDSAIDQRDILAPGSAKEADFVPGGEIPAGDLRGWPTGSVNLLTTPKSSTETLTLDNNTLVGDISNELKQQMQELDERERSVGEELDEANLSRPKETEQSAPPVDQTSLEAKETTDLTQLGQSAEDQVTNTTTTQDQPVDETVDFTRVAGGLSEEALEDVKKSAEQEVAVREEAKKEIVIDSENNLNFSGHEHEPSSSLTQNGGSTSDEIAPTGEQDPKLQGADISTSTLEKVQVISSDSRLTEVADSKTLIDDRDNLSSNGLELDSKSAGVARDESSVGEVDINKFLAESKSSDTVPENSSAPAYSSELDLMKQVNMDSGYVNNKHSDDEATPHPSKTEIQPDESESSSGDHELAAPSADISNSDAGVGAANQEEETHGELYRQLHISPKERKVSLDMEKNTLRRKLSSRSSSSASSSHASSSASSSLERVVQNDIKSDYEELAARMTTNLIASGGGGGGGDKSGQSSDDLLGVGSAPDAGHSATHQQLAEGASAATNLLD